MQKILPQMLCVRVLYVLVLCVLFLCVLVLCVRILYVLILCVSCSYIHMRADIVCAADIVRVEVVRTCTAHAGVERTNITACSYRVR